MPELDDLLDALVGMNDQERRAMLRDTQIVANSFDSRRMTKAMSALASLLQVAQVRAHAAQRDNDEAPDGVLTPAEEERAAGSHVDPSLIPEMGGLVTDPAAEEREAREMLRKIARAGAEQQQA